MTEYIKKRDLIVFLENDLLYQTDLLESDEDNPRARSLARSATSKIKAIKRVLARVGSMKTHTDVGEGVSAAPPGSEWDERTFYAIAMSDAKPGARSAVVRAFADMKKPIPLLKKEFDEWNAKRLQDLQASKSQSATST